MVNFINLKIIMTLIWATLISCMTCHQSVRLQIESENNQFLKIEPNTEELFRVLITSERYEVSQMKKSDTIKRLADVSGDKYMCEELKKYDKMDEAREGILSIWLYPDSGRLMKVRPKQLVNLIEIDNLLIEDIQRWNFGFTAKGIDPDHFDIRYRIVLRKKQTDDEIMREVREKIKEKRVYR